VTIVRGQPWGELGPLPEDGVVVRNDAEAAAAVRAARDAALDAPPLGLLGGDLCRTVGGRGDEQRLRSPDAARLVVDLLVVRLDGGPEQIAVAHALVHSRTWLVGPVVALMNASWVGEWNVAPRAHPNDGMADLLRAELSVGDRLKARGRLPLGTHVPHPGIRAERGRSGTIELPRAMPVWLDGVRAGKARAVSWTVEPDAVPIVV
jgi:hypothetical protein